MSNKPLKVGIREAKAKLSGLVMRAVRGSPVWLTYRGKEVVQIVALRSAKPGLGDRLANLESRGLLSLPGKKHRPLHCNPIKVKGIQVQRLLQQDRNRFEK